MGKEHIEREAALNAVASHGLILDNYAQGHRDCAERARKRIAAIPAADVSPVVHGRWLLMGQRVYPSKLTHMCSLCKGHGNDKMQYCPNCGAKMDLGEENAETT